MSQYFSRGQCEQEEGHGHVDGDRGQPECTGHVPLRGTQLPSGVKGRGVCQHDRSR